MNLVDVYTCCECQEPFAVQEGQAPKVCPICESKFFEFSHETEVESL